MPKKTTHELLTNALIELEQIVQDLDVEQDSADFCVTETGKPLLHPKKIFTANPELSDAVIQDNCQPPESFTDE